MPRLHIEGVDTDSAVDRANVFQLISALFPNVEDGPSPRGSTYYKTLLSCPREFGLRYEAGLAPEMPTEALTVGWLFHVGLQFYYEEIRDHQKATPNRPSSPEWLWGGAGKGQARAYELVEKLGSVEGYGETSATLQRCFDGYFGRYDKTDRWRVIAIEETVHHHTLEYSARLDLLIEDFERGAMYIVEHKTARAITADLIDNYQLDIQILGQLWLLKECVDLKRYPKFGGARINIATKHKKGSHTQRLDVMPSPDHLAAFEESILQLRKIRPQMKALNWPKFWHCSGYSRGYSQCQFYDLCHNYPSRDVTYWRKKKATPDGFVRLKQHLPIYEFDLGR